MKRQITSLYDFFEVFPDEQSVIDHLRSIRWRDGAYCPHCPSKRVMHFSDKKTHKCHDCRQRFSIKVGTIFEDTKLPLRKWFAAIWLITSHKKGIASTQLAKDLQITQKTAWFVLHRLRYATKTKSFNAPLSGAVELDETLFGGKESNKHKSDRREGIRGTAGKSQGHRWQVDCVRNAGAWWRSSRQNDQEVGQPNSTRRSLRQHCRSHGLADGRARHLQEFGPCSLHPLLCEPQPRRIWPGSGPHQRN